MASKKVVDVTVRLRRRDGRKVTQREARAALWAAHKIAQRGGSPTAEMREWDIEAIDWRNTYPSGRVARYAYSGAQQVDEVLANMGGILETIGMTKLRVEIPS